MENRHQDKTPEDKDIEAIIKHNDLKRLSNPFETQSLDMCHFNLPSMVCLNKFTNLVSLCIVAQDIMEISGLEKAYSLERLWICETKISKIKGLDACTKLEELYLYANKIKKIEGLNNNIHIKKLWIFSNEIEQIENISHLKQLEDLNISGNKIQQIKNSLAENTNLKTLHIAGNKLSSFNDLLNLTRLLNLETLVLSSQLFDNNPICDLLNYQTFIIFHMTYIKQLDDIEITDESRKTVASTIIKKRMYYNTQIQAIHRNKNFLIRFLKATYLQRTCILEDEIKKSYIRIRTLQRFLYDHENNICEHNKLMENDINKTISDLMKSIQMNWNSINQIQNSIVKTGTHIDYQGDIEIRKLQLELETGGNIRLEKTMIGSSWYNFGSKFLLSEILNSNSSIKCENIKINRISLIYNRHIFKIFDNFINQYSKVKKEEPLYAMYTVVNKKHNSAEPEIFSVIENGFTQNNYKWVLNGNIITHKTPKVPIFEKGNYHYTIISRVYTKQMIVNSLSSKKNREIKEDLLPEYDSNVIVEAIRPEYLVEYYIDEDISKKRPPIEQYIIEVSNSNQLSNLNMSYAIRPYIETILEKEMKEPIKKYIVPILSNESEESEIKKMGVVNSTNFNISAEVLESTKTINFTGSSIKKIEDFTPFIGIKKLILCNNKLKSVNGIEALKKLEFLDLSFNEIKKLDFLKDLKKLIQLEMLSNLITDVTGCNWKEIAPNLIIADFRFNPIFNRKYYQKWMISHCQKLEYLDGLRINKKNRFQGNVINNDIIINNSSIQPFLIQQLSMRKKWGENSSSRLIEYSVIGNMTKFSFNDILPYISLLELDNCNLIDISDFSFENFVNLRWLSLRNNYIKDISSLTLCHNLIELSIDNNDVEYIDFLSSLKYLQKINASSNKIMLFDPKADVVFESLTQLNLENNSIRSLKGIKKLTSLMELYLGNNYISETSNIFFLKDLQKFIILDLTGNSICSIQNYRLFIIYHLSKLKVLDGIACTLKEYSDSREIYLGLLTTDILYQHVGKSNISSLTKLDLRNCKIKNIECFEKIELNQLIILNMDNNNINSLEGLRKLTSLKFLSLNNNKIEKLVSSNYMSKNLPIVFPKIEELHLGGNLIQRIPDISMVKFPCLKLLFLNNNKINKIERFNTMPTLIELIVNKNHIKTIDDDGFDGLYNLKELQIKDNCLKSIANLNSLSSLRRLYLTGNRIQDLNELGKLSLPNLFEIFISQNPITKKMGYRYTLIIRLPKLTSIDGNEITSEEKEKAIDYNIDGMNTWDERTSLIQKHPSLISTTKIKCPIKVTAMVFDVESTIPTK
ncbi:L domain-like protein [Piromyces finnis]|uniref:L domain-like protein n=1 Tax=Piromyces finnis TaxID=1754191 RepID=A0A1Y1UW59_9FUNG|nr:L domain-like protein [Piromyces finnis]|eukprot:ORX41716.1 L domain-like protein [Piromyces finnis]